MQKTQVVVSLLQCFDPLLSHLLPVLLDDPLPQCLLSSQLQHIVYALVYLAVNDGVNNHQVELDVYEQSWWGNTLEGFYFYFRLLQLHSISSYLNILQSLIKHLYLHISMLSPSFLFFTSFNHLRDCRGIRLSCLLFSSSQFIHLSTYVFIDDMF